MSEVEDFLTAHQEQEIITAIRTAERNTSGEIRVHLETHTDIDAFERTLEVFHLLKMDNTKLRNSVLIYVAVHDKTFVIYGDEGIHNVVPTNFWDSTRDVMRNHFQQGNFTQGMIEGILQAGLELQKHFPWDVDTHEDELPNEISKG
ncbi:TPM domain-containing protein [Kordia sp. YSTF-M3]|uniref:TPM domain-containing protein n=1 Tax=Kordia aestuariivivens TaxID=2759037 RepID=A0ABR7QDU4_9FLAO|nr:TPM domain-containing protein [Kordia aestuariivivens]MBC8756732.1 TPM domain-containing protein [Kordia aestuariivivens]